MICVFSHFEFAGHAVIVVHFVFVGPVATRPVRRPTIRRSNIVPNASSIDISNLTAATTAVAAIEVRLIFPATTNRWKLQPRCHRQLLLPLRKRQFRPRRRICRKNPHHRKAEKFQLSPIQVRFFF